MVTLDRIRLTGLLTKSPAQVGLFYAPATGFAVRLLGRQPLGGLSEPLGPSARPAPYGCAGYVPNRPSTVPAAADTLKRSGFDSSKAYRSWYASARKRVDLRIYWQKRTCNCTLSAMMWASR